MENKFTLLVKISVVTTQPLTLLLTTYLCSTVLCAVYTQR